MARRRSTFLQVQRSVQQQTLAEQRAQQQLYRQAERAQRERARQAARDEKERSRLHVEARQAEVEALNADIQGYLSQLDGLLANSLLVSGPIDFETLKVRPTIPEQMTGELAVPIPPPVLQLPEAPRGLAKAFGGAKKHAAAVEQAEREHAAALADHAAREAQRMTRLEEYQRQYNARVEAIERQAEDQHRQVDDFRARYQAGDVDSICEYFSLVVDRTSFPEQFPRTAKLGYMPESRQLVVEYDLPGIACVPEIAAHKYVKTGDKITQTPLAATKRRSIYADTIAQTALCVLHQVFSADTAGHLDTVVFNGFVNSINPGTGQPQRPCLVTVRTSKDMLNGIDLARVEPAACLKGLSASVSKSPAELAPVRPVLELSMVDPRFIQETDVLAELDQRPNLMDLTPGEFESLITNLFEKMGLETRLTQASRDGGVDCVAYDPRPIFGGKVVIQAKRYKHTVGVSAVRDLFGTMQNEGASKGILVTTSGYGKASFEFAAGKPLELLSGSNLLFLLAEHAGIEAKIEPPEDWTDPGADIDPSEPEGFTPPAPAAP